jgi:dihydroorotate dehydrogenase (fumarate)
MPVPPPLNIEPPLINSSNPWATDLKDLLVLYECPHTGAVTTRTSLLKGFNHDPQVHRYAFFDPVSHQVGGSQEPSVVTAASVNSLGYSPLLLAEYLKMILQFAESRKMMPNKGFIVSVTGTPDEVAQCYLHIAEGQKKASAPLAMEINLSCPNIPNAPPPAYDAASLLSYLDAVREQIDASLPALPRIPFGIKTPPYTHATEFQTLVGALRSCAQKTSDGVCPVSFITATNTLGSCLVMDSSGKPTLPGSGLGGMAGAPLHPLALGNVASIRKLLDKEPGVLGHIQIIGVGGVADSDGYRRMKAAGAYAVGVGTALGMKGVDVFAEISGGL